MPEMLVASLLMVVVGALTLGAVVGPIGALRRASIPDPGRAELEMAVELLSRTIRSARRGLDDHGVIEMQAGRLVLRTGPPSGHEVVVVEVVDGELRLRTDPDGSSEGDARILLRGVDSDDVMIVALDASGASVASDAVGTATAIALAIGIDGHRIERTIALRRDPVHARAVGW